MADQPGDPAAASKPPSEARPVAGTWLRRAGWAGAILFLLKGLAWLGLTGLVLARGCGS
jgi:hypothetical protein